MKTVETKDGGKTGQAAFRRLGLQDDRQLAGKAERKTGEITGHKGFLAGDKNKEGCPDGQPRALRVKTLFSPFLLLALIADGYNSSFQPNY